MVIYRASTRYENNYYIGYRSTFTLSNNYFHLKMDRTHSCYKLLEGTRCTGCRSIHAIKLLL